MLWCQTSWVKMNSKKWFCSFFFVLCIFIVFREEERGANNILIVHPAAFFFQLIDSNGKNSIVICKHRQKSYSQYTGNTIFSQFNFYCPISYFLYLLVVYSGNRIEIDFYFSLQKLKGFLFIVLPFFWNASFLKSLSLFINFFLSFSSSFFESCTNVHSRLENRIESIFIIEHWTYTIRINNFYSKIIFFFCIRKNIV